MASSSMVVVSLMVLLVATLVAWLLSHQWSSSPSPVLLPVERLSWSSSQPFARDVITRTLPIVLINTRVAQWKASKWTPESLRRQSSTLRDMSPSLEVKSSRDHRFRFTNMARDYVGSDALASFAAPFTTTNMTLPQFIDTLQRSAAATTPANHEYVYFSDGIGVLGPRGLDLLPEANMLSASGDIEHCDTNIWLGQAHVVTMPHYDTSYNLFVQIYGRKRFLLAPPSSFARVGLYPSLHPYYRQTHADIFNDTNEVASLLRVINDSSTSSGLSSLPEQRIPVVYEVILHPGDILFVPPFWLHRVTALDTSISVNAWCPCSEFNMINSVTQVALPFDNSWNDATLRTGVRRFITLVLNSMAMKILEASRASLSPQWFMKQLIITRYVKPRVVNESALVCPAADDITGWRSLCGPLSSTMTHGAKPHVTEHVDVSLPVIHDDDTRAILDAPSLVQRYQERAFDIAVHFTGNMPPRAAAPLFMDDDVRIISVANWVESLVAWTVGREPPHVARFIACCWRL